MSYLKLLVDNQDFLAVTITFSGVIVVFKIYGIDS